MPAAWRSHLTPSIGQISDIEVMLLLRAAGQAVFAAIAGTLLIVQFIAVYLRVLPYLSATFGCDTAIYKVFRWLGFPLGMLSLDVLMFLEPLGLLPIVPLSERMRQFIPAYKATRIVAEVTLESLPQCLLQSYILVSVMKHVALGTASASEHALLSASVEGATFAEILPRSITISVITMLKTCAASGQSVAREGSRKAATSISRAVALAPPAAPELCHPFDTRLRPRGRARPSPPVRLAFDAAATRLLLATARTGGWTSCTPRGRRAFPCGPK